MLATTMHVAVRREIDFTPPEVPVFKAQRFLQERKPGVKACVNFLANMAISLASGPESPILAAPERSALVRCVVDCPLRMPQERFETRFPGTA
jgi:hypothetical protein